LTGVHPIGAAGSVAGLGARTVSISNGIYIA
jgi:hypothetical protein